MNLMLPSTSVLKDRKLYDIQSLNNDELGMAVIVPDSEAGKIGRTTDINFYNLGFQTVPEKKFSHIISETYYIGQKCSSGEASKHYFFSVQLPF